MHFSIQRVFAPGFPKQNHDGEAAELGGQREWAWAYAMPFRVLAQPRWFNPMPQNPTRADQEDLWVPHPNHLGYWSALDYFLTFALGWTRPDLAFQRLNVHESGENNPTLSALESPELDLIQQVWGEDYALPKWGAFISQYPVEHLNEYAKKGSLLDLEESPSWFSGLGINIEGFGRLRSEWSGLFESVAESMIFRVSWPFGAHLEYHWHIEGAVRPDDEANAYRLIDINLEQSTATLICSTASGWYDALARLAPQAETSHRSSWRIDVWVKPFGFLGTFRQSRVTGLWFRGKHSVHLLGNALAPQAV